MKSKNRHPLATLTLSFICASAGAGETCDLVGAEKINKAFPTGAPWIAMAGAKEPTLGNRCQFATAPRASGNIFVDTKNMFVIKKRLMESTEAETYVINRMEAHRKDASYEVHPIQVSGGTGFLSLHKSKADQATKDALFLVGHHEDAIIEESLNLQRRISQADQDAAEALMLAVLGTSAR